MKVYRYFREKPADENIGVYSSLDKAKAAALEVENYINPPQLFLAWTWDPVWTQWVSGISRIQEYELDMMPL